MLLEKLPDYRFTVSVSCPCRPNQEETNYTKNNIGMSEVQRIVGDLTLLSSEVYDEIDNYRFVQRFQAVSGDYKKREIFVEILPDS